MASHRHLAYFESLRGTEPPRGWLRAVREAAGLSAGELGRRLGVSRQLPLQFEQAEAAGAITLKSLRTVAAALGCELVYALVPARSQPPAPGDGNNRAPVARHAQPEPAPPKLHGAAPSADPHFCD